MEVGLYVRTHTVNPHHMLLFWQLCNCVSAHKDIVANTTESLLAPVYSEAELNLEKSSFLLKTKSRAKWSYYNCV